MSILDTLIGILAPHNCLLCGSEGNLLCPTCSSNMSVAPEYCYRCQKIMNKSLTCAACRQLTPLQSVRVAVIYEAAAKQLIWQLKLAGAQAAAEIMAERMAALLRDLSGAIIIPVPTATSRVRQRGYDQATLLARELARQTRLAYYPCLKRSGQTHQHGLPRRERLAQLSGAFRVSRLPARRTHVILVDDVTTTGATLEAAAVVLSQAGVARIDAVVFARPAKGKP